MNEADREQDQLLFSNGFRLLQAGKLKEVDSLFAKANKLNPENIDALNLLGIRFHQNKATAIL